MLRVRQVIGGGTGERRRLRTGDTGKDFHEGNEDDLNKCLTQFGAFSLLSEPILLSQWSFVSQRNSLTQISVHFANTAKKHFRFKLFCISFASCLDSH